MNYKYLFSKYAVLDELLLRRWWTKCNLLLSLASKTVLFILQNYWEVNLTCCLNDSSSRSLSEANLWLSRRTSRSASSPCKVIVCVMFRSNSKFVLINKTYRPREWSILHWLYVDAVKAEFVSILKMLDTYSISTTSRDETLISRNETFSPKAGLQWWSNGGFRWGSRGDGPPTPPRSGLILVWDNLVSRVLSHP